MSRALASCALALCLSTAASAGTVVVHAQSSGTVPAEVFESMLWHALYTQLGHDATFVPALNAAAAHDMQAQAITTALSFELEWQADRVYFPDDTYVVDRYPIIKTTEHMLVDGELVPHRLWTTFGAVALYKLDSGPKGELLAMPEISLQEATQKSLHPVVAPVWGAHTDYVRIPVLLAADEEFRAFYGPRWVDVVDARVARANGLLRKAGVVLNVVDHQEWTSDGTSTDLAVLLDDLGAEPLNHPTAIRIGFTQQTELAITYQGGREDVGRAYLPGRDVVIADQALLPGHDASWDVAEEGVAVAHEVLHALGIPHLEAPNQLMSAQKLGSVHQISASSRALAHTAATARFHHWDPVIALTQLARDAEAHLTDPQIQVDFIARNLSYGPGVPTPGQVQPDRLSALTNVVLGHYYLQRASEQPDQAKVLRETARAHSVSALATRPSWKAAARLRQLVQASTPSIRTVISSPPQPTEPATSCPETSAQPGSRAICH